MLRKNVDGEKKKKRKGTVEHHGWGNLVRRKTSRVASSKT